MYKLKHIVICMLLLTFALTISNRTNAASGNDERLGLTAIMISTPEIETWGAKEGIQHLSCIGTWDLPSGKFLNIRHIEIGFRFGFDYGYDLEDAHWTDVYGGNRFYIDRKVLTKRSTKKPDMPIEGDFLSCLVDLGDPQRQPVAVFSKKGSDLIVTAVMPGKKVLATMTIRRKDDNIQVLNKNGDIILLLKPVQPGAEPAPDLWKALRSESVYDLATQVLEIRNYAKKHNGKCPPMKTVKQWEDALGHGLGSQPGTIWRYACNPALSEMKVSSLKNTTGIVLLYDPKPWPDGTRCVAFASGLGASAMPFGVRIVSRTEWEKLAKDNHIKYAWD